MELVLLHVVSDKDPIPGFLISDHNASAATCYVPFGTYLFCSESGFSCFEGPQSNLELMIMSSRCAEHENLSNCSQVIDYGHILEQLKKKAVCRGISELPDLIQDTSTSLHLVIRLPVVALCHTAIEHWVYHSTYGFVGRWLSCMYPMEMAALLLTP